MRRRALALVLLIACGTPDVIGIKISPGMPTSGPSSSMRHPSSAGAWCPQRLFSGRT